MDVLHIFLGLVALLLLVGVGSIIYVLPLVKPHWRPACWVKIGMGMVFFGSVTLALVNDRYPEIGIPRELILWPLEIGLVLVPINLILVAAIHRWESKLGR